MRLKHFKIHNYRSIKDLEIECLPMVVLIGPNNHGKSNVLKALEFGLSNVKPDREDLFAHCGEDDCELWVEMAFHELTAQEKTTFQRYVLSDDTICIRKTARFGEENVEVVLKGFVEQPKEEWLHAENAGNYTSRDVINQTPLKDLVSPSGRLTKTDVENAQQQYIREHKDELKFHRALETSPLLGQKNVAEGILPDFYLLPAVSVLTDEIKVKTGTIFGRLLNRIIQRQKTFNLNEQIQQSVNQDIGRVFMIPEDFERHCGIPKNQVEKKGKALAALDHFSQSDLNSIPQIFQDIIDWMASDGETGE